MGINITLHKQVVFMTSLCSLYYNFSMKSSFVCALEPEKITKTKRAQ